MINIMMRHADGYEIYDLTDDLKEAVLLIENEAINIAECSWTGDYDKIFPIYWECRHEDRPDHYDSGFVDENGYLF